ncbi:MAG: type II secretion system protein [Synechococcales bacterium]|nr:type II secretion system protein [Synechococcales bacterium]
MSRHNSLSWLNHPFLRRSHRWSNFSRPRHTENGLTLVECLVAIVMVAVTGALMTPPLFLAAATRVQNRRSEQALQIAQGEIDRIRTLVERSQQTTSNLPAVVVLTDGDGNTTNVEAAELLRQTPAPTGLVDQLRSPNTTCNNFDGTYPDSSLALRIDVDGDADCEPEFFVQYFRDAGRLIPGTTDKPGEFRIGVRVYAISASDNFGNLSTESAALKFTSGEGNQRERPLAVLSTEVVESDIDQSICQYHDLQTLCTP